MVFSIRPNAYSRLISNMHIMRCNPKTNIQFIKILLDNYMTWEKQGVIFIKDATRQSLMMLECVCSRFG